MTLGLLYVNLVVSEITQSTIRLKATLTLKRCTALWTKEFNRFKNICAIVVAHLHQESLEVVKFIDALVE